MKPHPVSAAAKRITLLLFVLAGSRLVRADEATPPYLGAKPGALAESKARLAAGDKTLQPALEALLKSADKALKTPPPSVVEKSATPPSGDKHDYMSNAPYYWPDPEKPDGLPYIRRDGQINPESRDAAFDHNRIAFMAKTVETLALAYYFSGKETYAQQAAKYLRIWFLDPATRMNPNMKYAQAVPGQNTGRGSGILEGRNIAQAVDAMGLLAGSSAWTPKDDEALKAWLSTYLDWLLTSKNGRYEAGARNNHGTFYDVQTMKIALVLGRTDLARKIAEAAQQKRIASQIEPDGRQPRELERTTALGYSFFNLKALFDLATLSEQVGVDLWHYQTPDGRGLRHALDFLLPYVENPPEKWPYQQIKEFKRAESAPLLRRAAQVYADEKYEKLLAEFPGVSGERFQLLCPTRDARPGRN